jgi:phosphoribosylformylglycinamidine synthase
VVAYSDNAAVMEGGPVERWLPQGFTNAPAYGARDETAHVLMKVETHNHPTAISPFPGAATGAGGEIRDEGATGRGARPKAGLTGFTVATCTCRAPTSPGSAARRQARAHRQRAADHDRGPAGRRRLQQRVRPAQPGRLLPRLRAGRGRRARGYHKPIMIAGGLGSISAGQTHKLPFGAGTLLVQLGGPGMRIGMGGGAASSMAAGTNTAALDFDSVQRGNPEIQRRAQEVINHCWALGEHNPILAIHDVGAGGISNAFPELVDGAGKGARSTCAGAAGGERPGAEGDLVQREPGALRAGGRPDAAAAVRADVRARALPLRGGRRGHRRAATGAGGRPRRRAPSTCRWTCCWASRRRCTATCSAWRAPSRRWT